MASLTGEYATGTASVDNGDTTVTLSGGVTTSLVPGDPFYADNSVGLVASITDSTHFELRLPWAGSDLAGAPFVVPYLSTQRYMSAFASQKQRELLAKLDAAGVIYYVPSVQSVPDPALGNDGDVAIKLVPGAAWTFWLKVSAVWVSQGSPIGVAWRSVWAIDEDYITNDIVSRLGRLYISLVNNTGYAPESNALKWELLFEGGERYDLAFDASDRPDSGDRFRRFIFTTTVTFSAGLGDSRANALIAGTTSDAVFSIKKNGTQFATITFAVGSNSGVFACASDTTFDAGDVLELFAPSPRNATLADIAVTLTGFR